ncbi:MAG: hypothetical protein AAGJ79_10485, partial [Verrucomicrobiota bacterium]
STLLESDSKSSNRSVQRFVLGAYNAYEYWALNNGVGGPGEDPDLDELQNFGERALNFDPNDPGEADISSGTSSYGGTNYFNLTHARLINAGTVEYFVEVSDDPVGGLWSTPANVQVTSSALNADYDLVGHSIPMGDDPIYIRLRVNDGGQDYFEQFYFDPREMPTLQIVVDEHFTAAEGYAVGDLTSHADWAGHSGFYTVDPGGNGTVNGDVSVTGWRKVVCQNGIASNNVYTVGAEWSFDRSTTAIENNKGSVLSLELSEVTGTNGTRVGLELQRQNDEVSYRLRKVVKNQSAENSVSFNETALGFASAADTTSDPLWMELTAIREANSLNWRMLGTITNLYTGAVIIDIEDLGTFSASQAFSDGVYGVINTANPQAQSQTSNYSIDRFVMKTLVDPLFSDLPVQDGLVLHLNASQITGLINGEPIGAWANLAAFGAPMNAGSIGTRPTYQSSALHGRAVARFDGTDDMFGIGTLRSSEGPIDVFIVAQSTDTGDANWQRLASAYTSGADDMTAPNWSIMRPNNSGAPLTMAPSIMTKSLSADSHLDGIELARNANSLSDYYGGDIAEVVIYDRHLTASERNEIGYHLAHKYGLTVDNYVDALIDSDNDGIRDLDELIAGTLVNDPGDYFTAQTSFAGGQFEAQWSSVDGREYVVKRSFDLERWDDIGTFVGDDLDKLFTESTDTFTSVFYMIGISHP